MTKRKVRQYGTNKAIWVDPNPQLKAEIGVNVYYNGKLLKPEDLLNVFAGSGGDGSNPTGSTSTSGVSPQSTPQTSYALGKTLANKLPPNVILPPGSVAAALPLLFKGDLLTYGTYPTRLPVGANGTVPIADSTQTLGIRWGSAPGSGAGVGAYSGRPAVSAGAIYIADDLPRDSYGTSAPAWEEFVKGWKVAGSLATEILADNPTSYWKCDDGGATLTDYGVGPNAPINLTVQSNGLVQASALLFSEDTNYFAVSDGGSGANSGAHAVGNPANTHPYNGDATIEAMVYLPISGGAFQCIFGIQSASVSNAAQFQFYVNNANQLDLTWYTSGGAEIDVPSPSKPLTFGKVQHVCAVKDATAKTVSFYVDGIYAGKNTYTTECSSTDASPTVWIGNSKGSEALGVGCLIGHVAFYYNKKLTYARIKAHARAAGVYASA